MSHRFSVKAKFEWNAIAYQVMRRYRDEDKVKWAEIKNVNTGSSKAVKHDDLVKALFEKEIWFDQPDKIANKSGKTDLNIHEKIISLDEEDEEHKRAKLKLKAIEPLLGIKRTREIKEKRVKEIEDTWDESELELLDGISVRSLERWLKDYSDSGGNLRSLFRDYSKTGGKGETRKDPRTEALIQEAFDATDPEEPITHIHDEFELKVNDFNQGQPLDLQVTGASRATIGRRIAAKKKARSEENRDGAIATETKNRQFGAFEELEYPQDRVEFDGTRSDLIVLDDEDNTPLGRLTLILAIDVVTRMILGYYLGFEPESWYSVAECAYNAFGQKQSPKLLYDTENEIPELHGIPFSAATDHGKAFANKHLVDSFGGLQIRTDKTPIMQPVSKPYVEALNKTFAKGFFHLFPGTTFSNILQRGNYRSEQEAAAYLSGIDRDLNIWMFDEYAQTGHSGLKGETPAHAWERFLDAGWEPRLPPNSKSLSIILSRTEIRSLTKDGIEYEGLRWQNTSQQVKDLRKLLGTKNKVVVKIHPGDLLMIWVRDPFTKEYIPFRSVIPYYTSGLSLWKHKTIRAWSKMLYGKEDTLSLARTRRRLRENRAAGKIRVREARLRTQGRRSSDFAGNGSTGMLRPSEEIEQLTTEETEFEADSVTEDSLAKIFEENRAKAAAWKASWDAKNKA